MYYFNRTLNFEDKGYLHFSFHPIIAPAKLRYQVSVLTRGPQKLDFEMEERYGQWKIVTAPLPPKWIIELEPILERLILEQSTENLNLDHLPFISMNERFAEPGKVS
jgi:hypothetical protein